MKALASIAKFTVTAFQHNPRYLIVLVAVLMPLCMFYCMPQIASKNVEVLATFGMLSLSVLGYMAWIVGRVLGQPDKS
jgi:hypothetical protein